MLKNKRALRKRRHARITAKLSGSLTKPRMNVFRSLSHMYVQFIDDNEGKTLASASTKEISAKGGSASGGKSKMTKTEMAAMVGKLAAEKALSAGIKKVVFDRGGYLYHGRIKQLADAARAAGLEF